MIKGRKIAFQLSEGLKEFASDVYSDSYLAGTGALPGIREGRRIPYLVWILLLPKQQPKLIKSGKSGL